MSDRRSPKPLPADLFGSILDGVMRPGRYAGGEINSIIKPIDPRPESLWCLVYPDLYEMGMANLSLRILYEVLNRIPGTAAERSFLPDLDLQKILLKRRVPVWSLENRLPMRSFDFIGFTLQAELTATNVLQFLTLGRMHPLRERRRASDPIIVGGGPVLANPEPYADFFDMFVIGDAEDVLPDLVERWKRRPAGLSKHAFLESLRGLDGIYVPGKKKPERVRPSFVKDLDAVPFPVRQVVPLVQIPQDRASVELARGCLNNCRFCQAGYFYRPLRERSPEKIRELVNGIISSTGHTSISLLSLSTSNYSCLEPLMADLRADLAGRGVTLSLPSLRIDAFGLGLLENTGGAKRSGLTFALESLSPAVRRFLNKDIDMTGFRTILETAIRKKWKTVKIYLMFGFPVGNEVEENITGIRELADFVKTVDSAAGLTFHLMPFIPKPLTPFQWMDQESPQTLREKLDQMKRGVQRKNVTIKWHDIDMASVEAVLTRSGREGGKLIWKAWKAGALMDAWDDRFNRGLWNRLLDAHGRRRNLAPGSALPWDFLDFGYDREWMKAEYEKALRGESSDPCWTAKDCTDCGACGDGRRNIIRKPTDTAEHPQPAPVEPKKPDSPYVHIELHFCKTGRARWLSHLDLVGIFEKAFNASGLSVRTSFGFSPHRRMIFGPPISLGIESEDEVLFTEFWDQPDPADVMVRLNAYLPEGLKVFKAGYIEHRKKVPAPAESVFVVRFKTSGPVRKLAQLKLASPGPSPRTSVTALPAGKNIYKELEKAGIKKSAILSVLKKPALSQQGAV
jgi:radical SAM family uncharacterized protein